MLPDSETLTAIALIISAATPILLGFMAWMQNKSAKKAQQGTLEVKQALALSDASTATELGQIKKTTEQTHVLVNSQKGALMKNLCISTKASAMLAREKAVRTKTYDDEKVAGEFEALAHTAEVELASHESQQSKVDAQP